MIAPSIVDTDLIAEEIASRGASARAAPSASKRLRREPSVERFDGAQLECRQHEVVQERDVVAEGDRLDYLDIARGQAEQLRDLRRREVERLTPRFEVGWVVCDLGGIRGEDCGLLGG
ncbi:MAG: hypothetical protein WA208_19315 [Thermoanaerobaculia bacterium]